MKVEPFDIERVRGEFPILSTRWHGRKLVYLDNGATTQKPAPVIARIKRYYECENANIHRGVYELSQTATEAYESARKTVARFIGAPDARGVIFTRGATEAINLVAAGYGRARLSAGDEVLISTMEHHSNIVPWQMACAASGATLRAIPINDAGELDIEAYRRLLNSKTKLVAVTHLSNALGTINDATMLTELAHAAGARILIDGAQWVAHFPTDVASIGCDYYLFSGHKLFGPTGIGALWGRTELLEALPPYQGGGDMIETVTLEKTTYAGLPSKFEAGTPNIAGAVGLAAAIAWVESVGFAGIVAHEEKVFAHATRELSKVPGLRMIGTATNKASVLSFVLESPAVSALDAGTRLDERGIAVRTGHHCCQPVMDRLGIGGTIRASLSVYNTIDEVDQLTEALRDIVAAASAKEAAKVAAKRASEGADGGSTAGGSADVSTVGGGGVIAYPSAAGASVEAVADELAEIFDLLGDRTARNEYLLDVGAKLPDLFGLLKKVTPRIPGCMSEVYVVGRRRPGSAEVLEFVGDANAEIVRGLIALMQKLFSGQKAEAILAFDIEGFLRRIELDQFITAQRRNGLAGMIGRIRELSVASCQLSGGEG